MKRFFQLFIAATCLCVVSCNPKNDDGATDKNDEKNSKEDKENKEAEDDNSNIGKAATAYCDCFKNVAGGINPTIKRIFINASKKEDPERYIQNEMTKVGSEEEQMKLLEGFQGIENSNVIKDCSDRIKKKYNIEGKNKETQKQVLNKLDTMEDCELLAALLRISIKTENTTTITDDVQE